MISNYSRIGMVLVFFILVYVYIDTALEKDNQTKYEVHAVDRVFHCEDVQKIGYDLIGYDCNNFPVVEFRSPHVVIIKDYENK